MRDSAIARNTPRDAESARPGAASALVGLSSREAAERLRRLGGNELVTAARVGVLRELGRTLASPLILILLAASVIAAFVGDITNAAIIAFTVLLGGLLDAYQTARSSAAVQRLQHTVVPTATVQRDGAWRELPRREVVPGDLIRLGAGDVVPADARLVTARDLHVQQAALTGESLPAEKQVGASAPIDLTPPTDPHDADAVFLGTSVVGGTAVAVVCATGPRTAFGGIAERLREAPPPTQMETGLRHFGVLLARTVVFLVLFLALVSITLHRDPVQSLLFAVALAVGVIPEFMPMVTSITLSAGAVRMSRQHVIVKHLAAIHDFGGMDVLCSDKTGTLTSGTMTMSAATDVAGEPSDAVRDLAAATSHLQTGIRNALDDAINAASQPPSWPKLDELPFDFERRRMSIVVRRGDERLLIAKGAPEHVVSVCTQVRTASGVAPLDDARRHDALARVGAWSANGVRCLAIASRVLDRDTATRADESALVLEGWLTFVDPPLSDARSVIAALAADGVALKILTGDDDAVARHVCAATGIDVTNVILGHQLESVSDAALGPLAERTTLFARVTPQQKLRIVVALRARGHVVGYLGDGINDAPSLHTADVGISVAGAVDVAKDAADIVLLDRRLDILHAGILEGRKAFGNVMKYVLMSTSSNFGNMFSMAVASLAVPFLPMLPTQILLNNFLYDVSQVAIPTDRVDASYVRKPHQWDMKFLRRFMIRMGLVSSAYDILTFAMLIAVFHAAPAEFRTGWFIESLMTQTLVLLVIRTAGNPLRNRPSRPLMWSVSLALAVGVALPFSPLRGLLGFTLPPAPLLLFVVAATAAYLVTVQIAKRRLVPQMG